MFECIYNGILPDTSIPDDNKKCRKFKQNKGINTFQYVHTMFEALKDSHFEKNTGN